MTTPRTLEVKALSRVEGEGALYVKLQGESVERVELQIYEPPRFFESFLRGRAVPEVSDIVARICGICPVAYQMSACHALEKALGIEVTPEIRLLRRLLYCGEWIESHALHVYLLHLPDFLGYESGISLAGDHRQTVERGLRMKQIGNELLEVVGGRAIHPINVTVGGFYRAPPPEELQALLPKLQWALQAAEETLILAAGLDFPSLEQDYLSVAIRDSDEYPMNHGRVVSSGGLDIPVEEYEQHFQERHVPWSTALHSVTGVAQTTYLVGPVARMNLCFDRLPPRAREAAERSRVAWPLRNNFYSIVARSVELIAAYEEAIRIIRDYHAPLSPSRVAYQPRAGEGCHATEAPRGLLYHRYRIGDDGLVAEARIVPPTSQNQGQIEADLVRFLPSILHLDDQAAARKCEHLIRNYDPCISCATHFLKLRLDRSPRREG